MLKNHDILTALGIESVADVVTIKREGLTVTIKKDETDEIVTEPSPVEETLVAEKPVEEEQVEPIPEEELEALVDDIREEGNIAQTAELEVAKEAFEDLLFSLSSVSSLEAFDDTSTSMMHTAIDATYATLQSQPPSQILQAREEDPEEALALTLESVKFIIDRLTGTLAK